MPVLEANDAMIVGPSSPAEKDAPVTRIEASRGWISLQLGELWGHRELLYFLVWRDLKVRYKQTVLGAGWAIAQPLFNMLIFTLFFGRLAKMPSDGLPYPLFAYAALVPWTFFANGLSQASNSVVSYPSLVKKVYFPRLSLPLARVLACLVDFGLAFLVLIGMLVHYQIDPSIRMVWLPLFLLLAVITSLGVSLWFAALNVLFRDVQYLLPFIIQFWLFATPIVYPSSLVPKAWRVVYGINPMVGVVNGFRWALLGTHTPPGPSLLASLLVAVAILVGGAYFFRRTERTFADVL
jgi:lipopolysaccharide transport system permease protein